MSVIQEYRLNKNLFSFKGIKLKVRKLKVYKINTLQAKNIKNLQKIKSLSIYTQLGRIVYKDVLMY